MRTRNKTGSTGFASALEIVAAAFILLGPSIVNAAGESWGLYAAFILISLCFGIRLLETGRIHMSVNIALGVLLGAYALMAFAWADSTFRHMRCVFTIFAVTGAMLLAADYFSLEREKGLSGRLMYMLIFSADICALWNLLCWAIIDKFSLSVPFSSGMGQSDLLGVLMFVGLWNVMKIYGDKQRISYIILGLPMLFVLIMSRSALTLFFGSVFAAIYLFKKNRKLIGIFFAAVALAAGAVLTVGIAKLQFAPFIDGLFTAVRYPAGLGGGGFVSRQAQLQSVYYPRVSRLGTGASIASSLGVFGFIIALVFICREIYLTLRHKSWFCAFAALLSIYAFFAPVGSALAGLILLMCVSVYSEWQFGAVHVVRIPTIIGGGLCVILGAAAIYGAVLGVGEGMRASGQKLLASDERAASERFAAAASINPFDGESSYGSAYALRHLYEQGGAKEDAVNAIYHLEHALEMEQHNALYRWEYARLLTDMGQYANAALEGETAIKMAPLYDSYKVGLSEILERHIEGYQRGSLDAQRVHLRILELAEEVDDLDSKKLINDCADRVQPYTRIDFYDDETEAEAE